MSISLKPLADKLVVEPAQQEQMTASGIVLPETAKEKPQQGIVLAVGPGKKDDQGKIIPMDVKVGDKVLYARYGGTEVKHDGRDLLILSEDSVLAIIA